MKRDASAALLRAGGYLLSVLPPLCVAALQFPVWMRAGEGPVLSVFGLLTALLCCLPFWRGLRDALRSPSAWQMWLAVFLVVWLTAHISRGMMAVAAAGVVGSLPGAMLFKLADAKSGRGRAGRSAAADGETRPERGRSGPLV